MSAPQSVMYTGMQESEAVTRMRKVKGVVWVWVESEREGSKWDDGRASWRELSHYSLARVGGNQ